jgi:hypothetical protein
LPLTLEVRAQEAVRASFIEHVAVKDLMLSEDRTKLDQNVGTGEQNTK